MNIDCSNLLQPQRRREWDARSHPRVQATTNRKECLNSVKLSEHSTFAYTATIELERVDVEGGGIESAGKPGREGIQLEGGREKVAHEILIAPVTVVRRRQRRRQLSVDGGVRL